MIMGGEQEDQDEVCLDSEDAVVVAVVVVVVVVAVVVVGDQEWAHCRSPALCRSAVASTNLVLVRREVGVRMRMIPDQTTWRSCCLL